MRDKYVRAGSLGSPQWGYDGKEHFAQRRLNVSPYYMTGGARFSLVARGLLLEIFCSYWSTNKPVDPEDLRFVFRLKKQKLDQLINLLVLDRVVEITADGLVPVNAFGPGPDHGPLNRRRSRSIPKDWAEIRDFVFARDGFGCVYCGSGRDLHCDHVKPICKGGTNDIDNLATACATCNLSKAGKTLAEWRPDIARAFEQ
jgi:hypothetical protein